MLARLADPLLADRRRRQIMDAAQLCFSRRGFHQATMQEICAEAQISAGALYRYFSSKADIIAAIAEEKRAEHDTMFMRAAERDGVVAAICLLAEGFYRKCMSDDGVLIAEILAEAGRDKAFAATICASAAQTKAVVAQALKTARNKKEIDPTLEPEIAASILLGAIEGIGLRGVFMHDFDPVAAIAESRALIERYLKPVSS